MAYKMLAKILRSESSGNKQKMYMSHWLFYIILATLLVLFYIMNSVGKLGIIHVNRYINSSPSLWTYECYKEACVKRKAQNFTNIVTLKTCSEICSLPSLWPKPTKFHIENKNTSIIDKSLISFQMEAIKEVEINLFRAATIFLDNLPNTNAKYPVYEYSNLKVVIKVNGSDVKPTISTNESYLLSIKKTNEEVLVQITAPTYFGARHALESLSQLILLDNTIQNLKILHDVVIEDQPAVPHRGLMVDTARNYFPVEELLAVLDGMAASKLNVFHLHLTDSVSFPIILPNNPNFARYGAYSPEMVYTPKDIIGLIDYANIRGIRVILEIDAPSHMNEGWNYADNENDKLVICGENNIFQGQLNPDNNQSLQILRSVYRDLLDLGMDKDNFHIGDDEVDLNCYRETQKAKQYSNMNLFWANFTNDIFDTVKLANNNEVPKNLIIWSSPLTNNYLSSLRYQENLVVQYWFGDFSHIIKNGYKIIFSTVKYWYLDCGFGRWNPNMMSGLCEYSDWQKIYEYRPWEDYEPYMNQILGGEACLWTEKVDVDTLQIRIWPRAAALAERLWSDPPEFDNRDIYMRLAKHNERLKERGIKVAAIWPRWCSMNPGRC